MSNKLRLEKIKALAKSIHLGVMDDDIRWLIEQVEKVEQLEQENERLKKLLKWEQEEAQRLDEEVTFQLEQLKQAQAKIERYEKALREIANEQEVGEGDFNADDVANNLIATAKEALEGGT
jgi:predicted  nucleic acid-binding Zn-ribbon protein